MNSKTFLITGAAKGLGAELSRQLAKLGHQLILLDKDAKALNSVYDDIENAGNHSVALYPLDLLGANPDDYNNMSEKLESVYGHIDGIFLNAAILPAFTPIESFDWKQWYEVLHTNLNANFHMIQQAIKLMKSADQATIVAITDSNISRHPAYYGAYGVAKAGLSQLMASVAAENPSIDCFEAKLGTFATETRGRLFPGENPTQLTQANEVARQVITAVLDKEQNEKITLL